MIDGRDDAADLIWFRGRQTCEGGWEGEQEECVVHYFESLLLANL